MGKRWLFIVYAIIGLYVFNLGMVLFKIPDSLIFLNKWVLMVGGVLIVLSGFKWMRQEYEGY